MNADKVVQYSLIFITAVVFLWAVYHAQAFLVPLSFAMLLAMLMVPVSNVLERWGFRRMWSSLVSTLIVVVIAVGVVLFLSSRASRFASELPRLMEQVANQYQRLRQAVQTQWGIELPRQSDLLGDESSGSASEASAARPSAARQQGTTVSDTGLSSLIGTLTHVFTGTMAVLGDMLLTLVYVFALLFYRGTFQEFLWRLTPPAEHSRIARIVDHTSRVARQYLWGRLLLIIILAIFYGIGFLVAGLQHALFLAIFASLFSIIPYIGPIIGIALPLLVALVNQSSLMLLLWVLAIFVVVQFIESYILEPLIVGAEVDVNPLFTILAVVAGSLLWGISGLILAIPILGVMRVIFDNFDALQPYGYLIGQPERSHGRHTVLGKIKSD